MILDSYCIVCMTTMTDILGLGRLGILYSKLNNKY